MPSLPYAVLNFDFAASLLHLSRGLAPYAKSKEWGCRIND